MEIGIFPDAQALADFAGQYLIKVMNTTDHKVLGVATGSTPLPLYERMRQAHAKGEFSLDDAQAFALDEYVGIDPDHPERYRNVLDRKSVV